MTMLSQFVLIFAVLIGNPFAAAGSKNVRVGICIRRDTLERVSVIRQEDRDCRHVVELKNEQLVLDRLDISSFKTGWYNLTNDYGVSVISLDSNNIVEVTRNIANDLPTGIAGLHLSRNGIKHLRTGTFHHNGIVGLTLRDNEIGKIEYYAFQMPHLTHLSLVGNRLIDTEFVATLPSKIEWIELGSNDITEITVSSFDNLKKLNVLDLNNNVIRDVAPGALNLPSLRKLVLSYNDIYSFDVNVFTKLPELRRLDISGNKLTVVEGKTFNLPNLYTLNVRNNDIKHFEGEFFSNLRCSTKVDVTKNSISMPRVQVCMWIDTVVRVSIFDATDVDNDLCREVNISSSGRLQLRKLGISRFERDWYCLPDNDFVFEVALDYNDITNVTRDIITGLPVGIEYLDLTGNLIKRLHTKSLEHTGIRYLTMHDNQMSHIEDYSFQTPNLYYLSLLRNQLKNTEFVATLPSNIEWLALGTNRITEITVNSFDNLRILTYLDLHDNLITTVKPSALNCPKLRELILSNNDIYSLKEEVFTGLRELRILDLSSNRMTTLNDKTFDLPNLNFLNISNNSIEVIRYTVMSNLRHLTKLDLTNNPILPIRVKICMLFGIVHRVTNMDNDPIRDQTCEDLTESSYGQLELGSLGISEFKDGWYDLPQNQSVSKVSLVGNRITNVTRNIVNDLPTSTNLLSLSVNEIERLERESFNHSGLRYLFIDYNRISQIDDNTFATPSLTHLFLSANRLNDVEFVATLPSNLQLLTLDSNKIIKITATSFSRLKKLIYVNLAFNIITTVEAGAFKSPFLLELDLSHNRIRSLAEDVFTDLPGLRRLDLSENRLTIMEEKTFTLPNLNLSNMTKRGIEPVGNEIFSNSHCLTRVDLKRNPMSMPRVQVCIWIGILYRVSILNKKAVEEKLCREVTISSFRQLKLNHLAISVFNEEWYCLPVNDEVVDISLADNKIVNVTNIFGNNLLVGIELLNLSGNAIERLERGSVKHDDLFYLIMDYNRITHIEDNTFETPNLFNLSLLANRLGDMEFVATLPSNIEWLDLGTNKITQITPNSFAHLDNLIYLNLAKNIITMIDHGILNSPSLRELILTDNGIYYLEEEVFTGLPKLERLDISRNKLRFIEIATFNLPNLNFLNLSTNDIVGIEVGAFIRVSDSIHLDLKNNPMREIPYGVFSGLPEKP